MLIAPWDEYCRKHWEHPRVVRFLDRCAYLLLRDGPGDTLTDYKVMMQGRREISESSCPSDIQDLFYAGAPVLRSTAGEEHAAFKQMFPETTIRPKESRPRDGRFERLTRARSLLGDAFPQFLAQPWIDPESGKEYPPWTLDDKRTIIHNAVPILRSVKASAQINQQLVSCLRVA